MKKKKINVKREVRLGTWSLLLASPVIVIGFLMSVVAIVIGIQDMQAGGFRYRYGVELVTIFTIAVAVYLGIAYLYIRRLKQLYRRGQQLGAEQVRVTEMVTSQSTKHCLMDIPIHQIHDHTTQETSSHNQQI